MDTSSRAIDLIVAGVVLLAVMVSLLVYWKEFKRCMGWMRYVNFNATKRMSRSTLTCSSHRARAAMTARTATTTTVIPINGTLDITLVPLPPINAGTAH